MTDFFFERFNINKHLSGLGFSSRASPAALLAKFKQTWETIIQESGAEHNWNRQIGHTSIPSYLQSILDIFVKEQAATNNSTETGLCTELFFNDDILDHLITLSQNDVPVGYRSEVIRFTSNLIGLIHHRFLFSHCIHKPISRLINACFTSRDLKYHESMLELEVNLCTKIESSPELLPLFFNIPKESNSASTFGLLDHVMKYVHSDKANGDRARTACPILFALASEGDDLEAFILKHDYPLMLVVGLSGLYAQLPTVMPDADRMLDIESSLAARRVFNTDLQSFLDYVLFLQKILYTCSSKKISQRILYNVQTIFLSTVLAASINSCSDFDGTTLTTLFYIQQLVTLIDEPHLSEIFVKLLISSEDDDDIIRSSDDEMRLGIRDILISKLNSLSEEVVTSTLLLFYTLMRDHPTYSFKLLFEKLPREQPVVDRMALDHDVDIQQHLQLVARYFALLPRDSGKQASLDAYIYDAEAGFSSLRARAQSDRIDLEDLFQSKPDPMSSNANEAFVLTSPVRVVSNGSTIAPQSKESFREQATRVRTDPTLYKIMTKFENLFSHSMKINVAMTGVLQQLVMSPYPVLYASVVDGDATLSDPETIAPSFYHVITKLMGEIDERRESLPGFDIKLAACKAKMLESEKSGNDSEWSKHEERLNGQRLSDATGRYFGDLDLDQEFLKNVVVLEEFIKELLAVIVTRGGMEYDHISYL
ncbi:hypothetical protein O5D80_006527 [Batrachochytrium dendrobatidis]|nr:hypothetical protein O5D80_006527 [Batrachochytrium dendrobatidis]